jgi:Ran GTPase-activating protein (RanGAP) involved in mRNA processing and transport
VIQGPNLRVLNLANCQIGVAAAFLLAEGLKTTQSLQRLDLTNCNLRDRGGQIILAALKETQTCITLRMARNRLATLTGQELGRFFKVNQSLEELDLGWNELFECVVPFLKGLLKNTSIRTLKMPWNALGGADFVAALCRLLRKHPALTSLDLSNNLLGASEAETLAKCLKKAKTLEEIRLGRNQFDNNSILILAGVFSGSTTLKILDLGEDLYIEPATAKVIVKLKQKNPTANLIYKDRLYPNPPEPVDLKSIAINRCRYLAQKPKRKKLRRDIGHFMLQLEALEEPLLKQDAFLELLRNFKAKLDDRLIEFLVKQFMTKDKKAKRVNVHEMAEYYLERYPTEPPPPKPEKKKKKKPKPKK